MKVRLFSLITFFVSFFIVPDAHASESSRSLYSRCIEWVNPFSLRSTMNPFSFLGDAPKIEPTEPPLGKGSIDGDEISSSSFDFTFQDLASNQRNVAEQLLKITDLSNDSNPLPHFVNLTAKQTSKALQMLSGEQYTSFLLSEQRSTQDFIHQLFTPVRTLSIKEDCEELCSNQSKAWLEIGGGKSFQNGDKGFKGFSMNDFGISVGIQRSMNDWLMGNEWFKYIPSKCLSGWTIGTALNYEHQSFNFDLAGDASMHQTQGALYALVTGSWYYTFSTLVLGYNTGSLKRPIEFENFKAKAHSKPQLFHMTAFYEAGLNSLEYLETTIQPFFSFETGYYNLSEIKEKGAGLLNLKIKQKGVNLTNGRLGIHFLRTQDFYGEWNIALDLSWNHLFNLKNHLKGNFIQFGDDFKIEGPNQGSNGIELALTGFRELSDQLDAYVKLSGEKWKNYSNIDLRLGMSWNW